ncbi:hypothetical protein [Mycobacterium sp. E1747]|uniref:hypothetical protein n=1 Tax=Mycobacterium sp. E1747 TaxID=1834128 RepID=UPI000801AE29|nr:hypothetical protein [Mycobacterium sp. E1747]OBH07935.1 hypothetical protein A5695_26975 [Mycobacterium sp. E1747]
MTIPILGTPSAYRLTRNYFLAECPARGWPTNFEQRVPDPLPSGRRFWTCELLNTVKPLRFTSSQLLQLRYYDPNGARAEQIAFDAWELWQVMPSFGLVQDVEHAGGPTSQKDPDYPDLERYVITAWVTVVNTNPVITP